MGIITNYPPLHFFSQQKTMWNSYQLISSEQVYYSFAFEHLFNSIRTLIQNFVLQIFLKFLVNLGMKQLNAALFEHTWIFPKDP